MDVPLPFSIFAGIISIMAFFIICIACSIVLRNLCFLGSNNLMWRSNDARRAADMRAEQQVTLHPPPPVAGNEGQTQVLQPFLTQNQLVQPIASQEQTKQEFPAQGYQTQHYPQLQHPVPQVPAQGYQTQPYPQQQEFQQPSTTPQFQPFPRVPEVFNQDFPPPYGDCVAYK